VKRKVLIFGLFLSVLIMLAACVAQKPDDSIITLDPKESPVTAESGAGQSPATMPARPGSGVTGDPSGNLQDAKEVSGTVKEVNDGLVLITLADGSDFMLRFSENSVFASGVEKQINVGNSITCTVKPEPTFTTPSQGEVLEVTENTAKK
jgi:hypothetical protein